MAKYRKKPVVIEAIRITRDNLNEIIKFTDGDDSICTPFFDSPSRPNEEQKFAMFHIHTLEGVMRADIGDWIIKGINGELYPCKPDIFDKTYELVVE